MFVTGGYIYPFGLDESAGDLKIEMPKLAQDFIIVFDSLFDFPGLRPMLPEFEFEISIPDEIIEEIDIDEVRNVNSMIVA